jgi:hypothetical protein
MLRHQNRHSDAIKESPLLHIALIMKAITTHFAALLVSCLPHSAPAQSGKEKEEFAKFAEQTGFAADVGAYDNLVYVRLRLNSIPVVGEPTIDMQGNAVAAALAKPLSSTDPGTQLWRVYFREAPALIAAAGDDGLTYTVQSYAKLLKQKKPIPGSLFESWLIDLRMIFTNSQSEALLSDPVRRNYVALLVYGAYLATVADSNEAKTQRAMLKGAVKAGQLRLSPAISKPSEELVKRAGVLAGVFEARPDTWNEFLKWFESIAR